MILKTAGASYFNKKPRRVSSNLYFLYVPVGLPSSLRRGDRLGWGGWVVLAPRYFFGLAILLHDFRGYTFGYLLRWKYFGRGCRDTLAALHVLLNVYSFHIYTK
jgi:hypothetical protein